MTNYADEEKVKVVLDSARREINRQDASLAVEYLGGIKNEIEEIGSSYQLAEYSLLLGEAFCASNNDAALTYLEEARERIGHLPIRQPDLELRLYERLGVFFTSRKPTRARENYSRAKATALEMGIPEVIARIEMEIILVDLMCDRDPELEHFRILRRVAKNGSYRREEQLAAWHLHIGETAFSSQGLRFARKVDTRNEHYFKGLLDSVRLSQK